MLLFAYCSQGPLSIDTKRQNEMLKALREQAINKLTPYKDQLKAAGYETVCSSSVNRAPRKDSVSPHYRTMPLPQTIHVAHGDARQTLVRVATYHKVDLVIAGKRSKKGIPGLSG